MLTDRGNMQAIENTYKKISDSFVQNPILSFSERVSLLNSLEKLVIENIDSICEALSKDLHKPQSEAITGEILLVIEEIRHAQKNLKKWMKPQKVKSPISTFPAKSYIQYDPKGIVLIIGPWNYPFQLLMAPLVGALAAGNRCILKPSELALNTANLVEKLCSQYFPKEIISVIQGGVPETTQLLELKFDHIFFTGSTKVGKVIMQAAAKHLTPITLELGGKSPTVVCESADLKVAAKRIIWGKLYNAGQTCVAPDYLYVHSKIRDKFIEILKSEIQNQFGQNPELSDSYARIINQNNLNRLKKMLSTDSIIMGGQYNDSTLYLAPTLLDVKNWDHPAMQEEIFGPILPILEFTNFDDLIQLINSKPRPLAAYLFTCSNENEVKFKNALFFGGGCINDVIMHLANLNLPFGGIGSSGSGNYHGDYSFKTFSHSKGICHRSNWFDLSARYAPYKLSDIKLLRFIFRI